MSSSSSHGGMVPSLPPHVPGRPEGVLYVELVDLQASTRADSGAARLVTALSLPQGVYGCLGWWGLDRNQSPKLFLRHGLLTDSSARGQRGADVPWSCQFPIVAPPKRFMAYLRDMRLLPISLYGKGGSSGQDALLGYTEVDMLPFLRGVSGGPEGDYGLFLSGQAEVRRSPEDSLIVGCLTLRMWTDWLPHADTEVRPAAEVLQSFEKHEQFAQASRTSLQQAAADKTRRSLAKAQAVPVQHWRRESEAASSEGPFPPVMPARPPKDIWRPALPPEAAEFQAHRPARWEQPPPRARSRERSCGQGAGMSSAGEVVHGATMGKDNSWEPPAKATAAHASHVLYLRVQMGGLRIHGRSSLRGLKAVYKLGPMQEVVARVQDEPAPASVLGQQSQEACVLFRSSVVSESAVWRLDVNGKEHVWGPSPSALHFHLWQEVQPIPGKLLGLAKMQVPRLPAAVIRAAAEAGSLPLVEADLEVCDIATGAPFGALRVSLVGGRPEALPLAAPVLPPEVIPAPLLPNASAFPGNGRGATAAPQPLDTSFPQPELDASSERCHAPDSQAKFAAAATIGADARSGKAARDSASAAFSAAVLRMAAQGISPTTILTSLSRTISDGRAGVSWSDGRSLVRRSCELAAQTVSLPELAAALPRLVEGLTAEEAAAVGLILGDEQRCAAKAGKRGPGLSREDTAGMRDDISVELCLGMLGGAVECANAGVDLLVCEVGQACGLVAGELRAWAAAAAADSSRTYPEDPAAMLTLIGRPEIYKLLKRLDVEARWDALEGFFDGVDPAELGAVPALPLAELFACRAKAWWRAKGAARSQQGVRADEIPVDEDALSAPRQPSGAALMLSPENRLQVFLQAAGPTAFGLWTSFINSVKAGERTVEQAANVLDFAAKTISSRSQQWWLSVCSAASSLSVDNVRLWLARVLEADASGVAMAVTCWSALGLRCTSTAAASVLAGLATPGQQEVAQRGRPGGACLRVDADSLRQLMDAASSVSKAVTSSRIDAAQAPASEHSFAQTVLDDVADHTPPANELQRRLFEAVLASGVRPTHLAALFGYPGPEVAAVNIGAFAEAFVRRQLPLSRSDLLLAGRSWTNSEGFVDVASLAGQYARWLSHRAVAVSPHRSLRPVEEEPQEEMPSSPRSRQRFGCAATPSPAPPVARSLDGQFAALVRATPSPASPSDDLPLPAASCANLPSNVVFACLDRQDDCFVTCSTMARFVQECHGSSGPDALQAAEMCDSSGQGRVAYRDFCRYVNFVDRRHREALPDEERRQLDRLRHSVCAIFLRLGASCSDSSREVELASALLRRGRSLDSDADAAGLCQLSADVGASSSAMPPCLAPLNFEQGGMLLNAMTTLCGLALLDLPNTEARSLSYRDIVAIAQKANALAFKSLDSLFGACLMAAVDPSEVFGEAMVGDSPEVELPVFVAVLEKAGVDFSNVDLESAVRVLDPSGHQRIPLLPVARGYAQLSARYGALLSELADRLKGDEAAQAHSDIAETGGYDLASKRLVSVVHATACGASDTWPPPSTSI
eukprot:TRINITY_DN8649_c0_g1_i1.p1 TRINITY_DN8649_c0_g1~~TRINITY_DN8649_c0_g1_i1.p1  ORF type:complete len:1537 (-),score=314.25 TRINITY_DN8649_c0_g1_i1:74-4684(-)